MSRSAHRPGRARCSTVLAAAACAVVSLLAGCGDDPPTDAGPAGSAPMSGELVVSAAASLTEAFTQLRDEFAQEHPGVEVTLNFASSGQLSAQIRDGAPADVVAFADTAPMDALVEAGLLAAPPELFAGNRMVIVTKPGNPEGIDALEDLATAGTVALCVDTAPCGAFAEQVLAEADVRLPTTGITRGADVKATLGAVTEGDAVAAVVYSTDAVSAGDGVDVVEVPEADDLVAPYPVAVLADAPNPASARAFVDLILSEEGREVLARAGFLAP